LNELGPAPPQMPRKDNANVQLQLLNRYQGNESNDAKEMKPEQIYMETKYLLFTIIKSMPEMSNIYNKSNNDIVTVLKEAQKYAMEKNDFKLIEKVKKIHQNCKKLTEEGVITETDGFAKLRKDTVQELVNYEAQIQKTNSDIERLRTVLNNIHEHNEFLKQQYEAYQEYLESVRRNSFTNIKKDGKSTKAAKKVQKRGPFKFSHVKLQQDGVIIESEVPEERRSNIFFSFSSQIITFLFSGS